MSTLTCPNVLMPLCLNVLMSTFHVKIKIAENIRKALDDGNIGCGVFVDLQKGFDTFDQKILLAKLNHYGIRGVSND